MVIDGEFFTSVTSRTLRKSDMKLIMYGLEEAMKAYLKGEQEHCDITYNITCRTIREDGPLPVYPINWSDT